MKITFTIPDNAIQDLKDTVTASLKVWRHDRPLVETPYFEASKTRVIQILKAIQKGIKETEKGGI
jgi:hypothetical protein